MTLDIKRRDTICALSTPHGVSALAIVRASGPKAVSIFNAIFKRSSGEIKIAEAMHGTIVDQHGEIIDDVMAILFNSRSFTGEGSFEIHCHGNPLIVDLIVESITALGARLAEPGEFSLRALLNGKIDLSQAESIADLIHAKSKVAKDLALKTVRGGLRDKIMPLREALVMILAEIEARMDFPDEDLGHYDKKHLVIEIDRIIGTLSALLENADRALKLYDGARILIIGLPNAGKSTLLNRLVDEDRAIVHETAGTTRDIIEASFTLQSLPLTLVDAAGIRQIDDDNAIEKLGIRRALNEIAKAHLVLWLADAEEDHPFSDKTIKAELEGISVPTLHVLNKIELRPEKKDLGFLTISAKYGDGIDELKSAIESIVFGPELDMSEVFTTRARQRDELKDARRGLEEAKTALSLGWADEIVTSELRASGLAFDRLFGTAISEDILDKIFSQFCIGK